MRFSGRSWQEDSLFTPREYLEAFVGVLQRQFRLFALCLLVFATVPVLFILALRPGFTATALVVVEPAPADLLAPGSLLAPEAPNTALVDGAVELMRAEPVLTKALALAAPVHAGDFLAPLDFRSGVLAFFGVERDATALSQAQLLQRVRDAVRIERRGVTPVIAISARSASPAFAARLANAVAEAHMALQWTAKEETLSKARALVEAQLAAVDAQLAQRPAVAAQHLDALRLQQQALHQREHDLAMQAALQLPDARLAAPASVPLEASFPDLRMTALIATLFAAALALGVVVTVDGRAKGVRSTAELAALVGVPLAVAMPRLGLRRADGTSHADQIVTAPLSAFAEAMRSLHIGLDRTFDGQGGRLVAVISAGEGEGKTTTALGLARSFAVAGSRVLLLDADVRSTALRQHLDIPSSRGLEQVLAGAIDLADLPSLVQRDPLSPLSVLINTGPSRLPADALFSGPAFAALLRAARASFDVTVLDMPSFRWPADGAHILSHMDAAVLVAGWGQAQRNRLAEMLAAVRSVRTGQQIPIQPVLSMQPQARPWRPSAQLGYSAR